MTQAVNVVRRHVVAQAPLDRHGPGWRSVRDGVAHDEGWPLHHSRYAALMTEGS